MLMYQLFNNFISLIYAKSPEYCPNSAYYIEGYVLVKNSDYDKKVAIHYTYDDISWYYSQANFFKTVNNDLEIWHFKTPSATNYNSCKFSLLYDSYDTKYWDNNHGKNYQLRWYSPTKILNTCTILLDKVFQDSTKLYGNIIVKNLAYEKEVKVKYSFDNWKTFSETNAIYFSDLDDNLKNWVFYIPISSSSSIKFVIYCTINDIDYYDNNFEMDYLI